VAHPPQFHLFRHQALKSLRQILMCVGRQIMERRLQAVVPMLSGHNAERAKCVLQACG
jgi:hypothetical protein